jgi:hypothetical protein
MKMKTEKLTVGDIKAALVDLRRIVADATSARDRIECERARIEAERDEQAKNADRPRRTSIEMRKAVVRPNNRYGGCAAGTIVFVRADELVHAAHALQSWEEHEAERDARDAAEKEAAAAQTEAASAEAVATLRRNLDDAAKMIARVTEGVR